MPTGMTFASLEQDLISYAQRGSTTTDASVNTQIPRIINLAEKRMARELKIQGFQVLYTSAFVIGQALYAKPDRWRSTISMRYGAGAQQNTSTPLRELSYEAANTYWTDRSVTAAPRFYADADYNHWLVVAPPDVAYPFEAAIWQLPPLLDATNQTNWLTDEAPNALLHGCLLELFGFLNNPEQAQIWGTQYDRDMAALAGEDLQKILDRYYKRSTS